MGEGSFARYHMTRQNNYSRRIVVTNPAQKLRALIASGDHFIAAEAYSALTGRIVERVGFKAAYLGGHACSAFHYAMPDNGIFSQVEQIEQAARIAAVIDSVGETVADAFHLTRRYVRAGIAGFHIEDEVNPKHSSYSNGLIPIIDMQARIEACVKGRGSSDFVIIARCDELYPETLRGGGSGRVEAAIQRGKAYAEAGADVLVFPLASAEATAEIVKEVSIPVCTLGFDLPDTAFTLSTGWGWMGAAQLHLSRAKELMETGTVKMDPMLEGKNALIEQDLFDELIADWARKTGRKAR
jgi:2-methylisocitrate lyase-like PEP mutase family enzyme